MVSLAIRLLKASTFIQTRSQAGELEERLNREVCDGKCEVLNFGVGGFGTLQEWLHYKRDGRRFGLDMVALLFVGNDLENNLPGPASSFDQNFYDPPYLTVDAKGLEHLHPPRKPYFYEILRFLFDHSAFFRLSYKAYYHLVYLPLVFGTNSGIFDVSQGYPLRFTFCASVQFRPCRMVGDRASA